jgi:hypothetical protein
VIGRTDDVVSVSGHRLSTAEEIRGRVADRIGKFAQLERTNRSSRPFDRSSRRRVRPSLNACSSERSRISVRG